MPKAPVHGSINMFQATRYVRGVPTMCMVPRELLRPGSRRTRNHARRTRRPALPRVLALPPRGRRARAREAQRYHKETREKPRAARRREPPGLEGRGGVNWRMIQDCPPTGSNYFQILDNRQYRVVIPERRETNKCIDVLVRDQ
ncbi:uncharacterized protein WM277_027786 [Molossus nigricans]